jgi:low affinity Fe/Cu permease
MTRLEAAEMRFVRCVKGYIIVIIIVIIIIIIIIISIQPLGRFGQRPELSQATGIALVRCILGKILGVG